MLSTVAMPREVISYHSVTLVPILTVAALYGARRIAPLVAKAVTVPLATLVLLLTLGLGYAFAPLPLPGALNFWQPVHWFQVPDPALQQVRALVDKGSSLSVQANAGAHFSQHQQVYRYPYKAGEAETIVLWLESPTRNIDPRNGNGIGSMSHHLQMKPAVYLASVACLLQNSDYGVSLWHEPWLVFVRGAKTDSYTGQILHRLDSLRRSWQISPEEYVSALLKYRES
jgi:hypothetical protein